MQEVPVRPMDFNHLKSDFARTLGRRVIAWI